MVKLRGIHAVALWSGLFFILSGCSTEHSVDATPSANDLTVTFYTGLWGTSGRLCSVAVPDNGDAPVCPEALAALDENKCKSEAACQGEGKVYYPDIMSIAFSRWRGFHVVCLRGGVRGEVLCVQGNMPEDNGLKKTIANMHTVRGFPELLNPLEVTHWDEEQFGKVTKITGFKLNP